MQFTDQPNFDRVTKSTSFATIALVCSVVLWSVGGKAAMAESFDCQVVDRSDGTGVGDATVNVVVLIPAHEGASTSGSPRVTKTRVLEELTFTTDFDGRYQLVLPDLEIVDLQVRISVKHESYLAREMRLTTPGELRKHPRSSHRRLPLKRAFRLRGRVLDWNGKPAVGAAVRVGSKYRAYSWKFRDPGEYSAQQSTTTNREGNFEIMSDALVGLQINRDDGAVLLVDKFRVDEKPDGQHATFTLPRPKRVHGRLVDFRDRPIAHAIVTASRKFEWNETNMPLAYAVSALTDENGEYELPALAADTYDFHVRNRLSSPDAAIKWKLRNARKPVDYPFYTHPISQSDRIELIPIQYVSIKKTVHVVDDETVVNFSPKDNLKVSLRVIDKQRDEQGVVVRILGKNWRGRPVTVHNENRVTLYVPNGLREAYIDTGPIRLKRAEKSDWTIGESVPLGPLVRDIDTITVERPAFAKFIVNIRLPKEVLGKGDGKPLVDFEVFYKRRGYLRYWLAPQKVPLRTVKNDSDARLHGTGMVGEEIVFQVKPRFSSSKKILHEERFTLQAGKKNEFNVVVENEVEALD